MLGPQPVQQVMSYVREEIVGDVPGVVEPSSWPDVLLRRQPPREVLACVTPVTLTPLPILALTLSSSDCASTSGGEPAADDLRTLTVAAGVADGERPRPVPRVPGVIAPPQLWAPCTQLLAVLVTAAAPLVRRALHGAPTLPRSPGTEPEGPTLTSCPTGSSGNPTPATVPVERHAHRRELRGATSRLGASRSAYQPAR
jgi:hypothetical protein